MSEHIGQISIKALREHFSTTEQNATSLNSYEKDHLQPIADSLRTTALNFIQNDPSRQSSLRDTLQRQEYIDGIISDLRRVEGGQEFVLRKLQELKSDLCWYRGGTLRKWGDSIASSGKSYFTPEQLETYIIDGGQNGVMGRPLLALSYLHMAPRSNPAFYTLTIDDLLEGVGKKAIYLVSEQDYDLRVVEGDNRFAYLDFCKNNLKIQRVQMENK